MADRNSWRFDRRSTQEYESVDERRVAITLMMPILAKQKEVVEADSVAFGVNREA